MASTTNYQAEATVGSLEFPHELRGKKVLLATESFGPVNGVSRTTLSLVQYLRRNGVNVAVVAPEISTSTAPRITTKNPNDLELRLRGYPLPYNPELSVVYPVRLSQLYARTFDGPPDLIYLASPASLGFQILLQLRQQQKVFRVPVLLNFQTDLSGYCEILFPVPLDLWAVWVFRHVQGYLFRHSSVRTVFYPSIFVKNYLEKAGVPEDKMINLRRGVDAEMFHPSKRDEVMRQRLAPDRELILLSVARLAPEKGFEFLAEVMKQLEKRDFSCKLVIVGGNRNPAVEEEIHGLFRGLRDGAVEFAGFLKGEALARSYASADLFLHCSITETFGLVVLESMASGIPVIARDEGGPSEIVVDCESGFLVPPEALQTFVNKVVLLGNDCNLREAMANESRRLAEEATWEKINNLVACKLAEALQARTGATAVLPHPAIRFYSWVLLKKDIFSYLRSVIVDVKVLAGLGAVFGTWVGLVITWILVQISLTVKSRLSHVHDEHKRYFR
ncbi:glycosyl transferase group 1 [Phlyctema vagabunda]|uniref:Glycosyl transferase group 1 n=1 Tax=Phlyctema vagabunda TaxID=108571 RepID=A0ABR4P3A7_9HELO